MSLGGVGGVLVVDVLSVWHGGVSSSRELRTYLVDVLRARMEHCVDSDIAQRLYFTTINVVDILTRTGGSTKFNEVMARGRCCVLMNERSTKWAY